MSDELTKAIETSRVEDNREAHRFEMRIGDQTAFLDYQREDSTIVYIHTEVPPALEGHGIAARIAKYALDYAQASRLAVVPLCPYVAGYIERHPEYRGLIAGQAR